MNPPHKKCMVSTPLRECVLTYSVHSSIHLAEHKTSYSVIGIIIIIIIDTTFCRCSFTVRTDALARLVCFLRPEFKSFEKTVLYIYRLCDISMGSP